MGNQSTEPESRCPFGEQRGRAWSVTAAEASHATPAAPLAKSWRSDL